LFIQRSYVTFNMTECESAQHIIMYSIKRLKHRIAGYPVGYNAVLQMTINETVIDQLYLQLKKKNNYKIYINDLVLHRKRL